MYVLITGGSLRIRLCAGGGCCFSRPQKRYLQHLNNILQVNGWFMLLYCMPYTIARQGLTKILNPVERPPEVVERYGTRGILLKCRQKRAR